MKRILIAFIIASILQVNSFGGLNVAKAEKTHPTSLTQADGEIIEQLNDLLSNCLNPNDSCWVTHTRNGWKIRIGAGDGKNQSVYLDDLKDFEPKELRSNIIACQNGVAHTKNEVFLVSVGQNGKPQLVSVARFKSVADCDRFYQKLSELIAQVNQ